MDYNQILKYIKYSLITASFCVLIYCLLFLLLQPLPMCYLGFVLFCVNVLVFTYVIDFNNSYAWLQYSVAVIVLDITFTCAFVIKMFKFNALDKYEREKMKEELAVMMYAEALILLFTTAIAVHMYRFCRIERLLEGRLARRG